VLLPDLRFDSALARHMAHCACAEAARAKSKTAVQASFFSDAISQKYEIAVFPAGPMGRPQNP
jgi:hypothetical protein